MMTPTHRHYKGHYLRFICEAEEEDLGTLIVYLNLDDNKIYADPIDDFDECVDIVSSSNSNIHNSLIPLGFPHGEDYYEEIDDTDDYVCQWGQLGCECS